jgi:hypothetical protein
MNLNTDKRGWFYTAVIVIISVAAYLTPARSHTVPSGIGAGSTDPRLASPAPLISEFPNSQDYKTLESVRRG